MSGIFGILSLDGGTPHQADIDAMAEHLRRRGPDGSHSWKSGPVALGHTLLATTPEALVEVLPLTDGESGCTITADCRLDNREELIAGLGLDGTDRVIGDGELILRAYLRWGEDCPAKLLGDFAFAIWDPRSQGLFCARDHIGMRQLLYHHRPGKSFLFATEAEAVLGCSSAPHRINQGRIADYLDNLEGLDLTSTFFEGIFRLPPASLLIVDRSRLTVRRYWQFEPPPELRLPSDDAYEEAFLTVFQSAVRSRLRAVGPVGVLLSGGIDSNAVAAVAADLLAKEGAGPLLSFSAVGPATSPCVESAAIRAAVRRSDLKATLVDYSQLEAAQTADLARQVSRCAEPFDAPMSLHRALYSEAARSGVRVMLDGVGGDLVFNSGNEVGELVRAGRIGAAMRQARLDLARHRNFSLAVRQMLATAWTLTIPKSVRRWRRAILGRIDDRRLFAGRTPINPDFAKATSLDKRRKQFRDRESKAPPFGLDYRLACLFHPHLVVGRERYDRIASAFALEHRDPFLDLRVIHFCLALPFDQLHRDGIGKLLLRRTMKGRVPSEVIDRRGKEHLGWQFTQKTLPHLDPAILANPRLANILNIEALSMLGPDSAKAVDRLRWFEIISLAHWLARIESTGQSVRRQGE